jgi:2-isopropylmalate synthase
MPAHRYRHARAGIERPVPDRTWPDRTLDRAPLWSSVDLRDGNQSLVNPMDVARKETMFKLLAAMGVKDIEVGYPSASQADFDFVRHLIEGDLIPDDVTINVFAPARAELIERTMASLAGARRAMVHLCNATAPLWRDLVYGLDGEAVIGMATSAAEQILRLSDDLPGSRIRFEYTPEVFNLTEPEFALDICNRVLDVWQAAPDRPVVVNLPATVETTTPNMFADRIEWMDRNLTRRDSVILSVHPHNDRGTGVASAELAMLAGAQRVEGTLFGNGERTGNVCLVTLALNLFSRGVDPQLDLSDIDGIRRSVEYCNELPVHDRHPYVGAFVYTAFSGTHQDAIKKGLDADRRCCGDAWQVPYLPIDPKHVGRAYDTVVRINSQSGKGGVAYLLHAGYGLELPRELQAEVSKHVQGITDAEGRELSPGQLYKAFVTGFVNRQAPIRLGPLSVVDPGGAAVELAATVSLGGVDTDCRGSGNDAVTAAVALLNAAGLDVAGSQWSSQTLADEEGTRFLVYAEVLTAGVPHWGAGANTDPVQAATDAVLTAVNRGTPG